MFLKKIVACRLKKIMSNHTNRSANVKNVKTLIKLGSGLTFIKYLPMKIFVVLLHIQILSALRSLNSGHFIYFLSAKS